MLIVRESSKKHLEINRIGSFLNVFYIILRFITGITGNLLIYYVINKTEYLRNLRSLSYVGMYTLEIYVTHMYVNSLFMDQMEKTLFSINGFIIFIFSLIITVIFSLIMIIILKSNDITNIIFFGKLKKK